jgi:hypothetical protein
MYIGPWICTIYIYVCTHIHILKHTLVHVLSVYTYLYIHMHKRTHTHIHTHMYHTYIHVCVCFCGYLYASQDTCNITHYNLCTFCFVFFFWPILWSLNCASMIRVPYAVTCTCKPIYSALGMSSLMYTHVHSYMYICTCSTPKFNTLYFMNALSMISK